MACKALFIGGIKSGKSLNAEKYTLKYAKEKPTYLATNEFFDAEMSQRVAKHKEQRKNKFSTLEEPLNLYDATKGRKELVLIECISMWINNMLYHKYTQEKILEEIELLTNANTEFVFVINDVSSSIVSDNELTRKFVDINGRISQLLASNSDEVFHTIAGIAVKIK